jgi:hypothetical protein
MPFSRRIFLGDSALASLFTLFEPAVAEALAASSQSQVSKEDTPHDPVEFWSGFFDSVNPRVGYRGTPETEKLPEPGLKTQYLHYKEDENKLRWATDIAPQELLSDNGDVYASIQISQFRPAGKDINAKPSQLRIDTTQKFPYLNLLSPMAWTAVASLSPSSAGKIPNLDSLGFKSEQATAATKNIVLTRGTGKMAVNISRAHNESFIKVLQVMIAGARLGAPLVALPAVSVPAMSAFSEAFAYWENHTRYLMNSRLTTVVATQTAHRDPEREDSYIGLVSGDYVMVKEQDANEISKYLSDLKLDQGYLVQKDADPNQNVSARASSPGVPSITYATMRVAVKPLTEVECVGGQDGKGQSSGQGQPSGQGGKQEPKPNPKPNR